MANTRRRHFSDGDRRAFYEAVRAMRKASIDVLRKAPLGRLDYRTAMQLMARLDDAVEALTGDRTALWQKPHSSSFTPTAETPLLPVTPEDGAP